MKYSVLIAALVFSNISLASEDFPSYMVGEWESLDKVNPGESYHYTLLKLYKNSGELLQIFYLLESEKENCIFKLDGHPIADDIYYFTAQKCNGKPPRNKRAMLLIPQNHNVIEMKILSYGSKNYRTELYSTYLSKVNDGVYLKDILTNLINDE